MVQIGIGVLDLSLGALAMYMLLPDHPAIDFITLLVIFVTATLLGFLSHAPGSLGVFEAAMLVGLPLFQKEGLLASLLIFRPLFCFSAFSGRTVAQPARVAIGRRITALRVSGCPAGNKCPGTRRGGLATGERATRPRAPSAATRICDREPELHY